VLLGYTNYDMAEEEALIEGLLRRRPEAIVVTGGAHTARCRRYLGSSGVPVVETWDLPRDPIGHVVGFSNAEAGRMMARYLYDRGYRRIGFIGGDTDRDTRGLDRRRGFELALRELGLDTGRLWASGPPPITMREGALAMERLLEALPDTEAVMCVSDLSAFGAMSACLRRGLRVPQDVAVAGFGAYDLSANCTPEITTIDVDPYAIGARAAAIIRETLERRDAAPLAETPRVRVEMPLALLERASTRRG
jgi:LacI family gluconate utilization system Gnt-I transcriptional repressor